MVMSGKCEGVAYFHEHQQHATDCHPRRRCHRRSYMHAEELHVGHGEELFGVKDAISLAMYMVVKTHEYLSLYPFPGAWCGYMSWSVDVQSKY